MGEILIRLEGASLFQLRHNTSLIPAVDAAKQVEQAFRATVANPTRKTR
jgi:hypothetical protein